MTFEQLLYAEVLSRCSSLQKAADILHITKPGLSLAIDQLESELGVKLFHRGRKGTSLTDEGRQVLSSIRSILKSRNDLIGTISDLRTNGIKEVITFRYMNVMLPSFINPFLDHYSELFSHTRLDISMDDFEDIIRMVENHTADAGFIACSSSMTDLLSGLDFTPVCDTKIVLACSKNNPLASKKEITAEDLQTQNFCVFNETFHEHLFDRLQFLCGPLKLVMRTDDMLGMSQAALKLNAVFLGRSAQGKLSDSSYADELCTKDIGNLIDDNARLGFVTNPKYELSENVKTLLKLIEEDIRRKTI